MAEKKSYFAIIPANVRYDDDLSANAKLLYGEITALCNEKGYCWASNDYFSQLYGKSKYTVSRWISSLSQKGYIQSEISKEDGNMRMLTPLLTKNATLLTKNATLLTKTAIGIDENRNTPIDENRKQNNTLLNNTLNNNSYIYSSNSRVKNKKKFIPPTIEEVREYAKSRNSNVDVQKFYDYYSVAKWHDKDGNPVKNWKQRLITWESNSRYKQNKKPEIDTTYDIEEINRRIIMGEDLDKIYDSI